MIKLSPRKRNAKRHNGCLRRSYRKKSERQRRKKERYTHLNAEFQRIARRHKKAFLSEQFKEIEENRMEKTGELFKKIRVPREHFMQRQTQ